MWTFGGHSDVGEELVSGVTQPHGFDIPGDNVGFLGAFIEAKMLDGSFEGVGKSFLKHIKDIFIHIWLQRVNVLMNTLTCSVKL
jgi:hypothetical protein